MKQPLTPDELQRILESHSARLETLEAKSEERITINMHHTPFKSSIPPQVRKHAPAAMVSGVLIAIYEVARLLVEYVR